MLAEVQPRPQPARTQGRARLLYALHSNCWRNPQGSLSNNHRAHYKISNADLKFTYSFLQCEKMIPCSCCVRDQCTTRALLCALCCCSCSLPGAVSWQELLLREAFAQCQLGLHGAWWTSGKQPLCFFSLGVLFKSHLLWNVLQDSESHLVPKSRGRGVGLLFGITTFLTHRSGNRLTCSPRTGQQWAGRDWDCPPTLPSQQPSWDALRAKGISARIWHRRETKSNTVTMTASLPLCSCTPARTVNREHPGHWYQAPHQYRETCQGWGLLSPTLARREQSEIFELLAASGGAGTTSTRPQRMGKIHLLPKCRWDVPSRKWEQPVLANSNHSAGSARWSAVHPMLPTQLG